MKYTILYLFAILFLLGISSCTEQSEVLINPPAEGFNALESDAEAIVLADKVMEANGGRSNWDKAELLQWNFFGSRLHQWNKRTDDLKIVSERDSFTIEMNLASMEGKVNWKGVELTKSDSLDKYLQRGKEMWINDSYWLFMPFKLKDSGVTLTYLGEKVTKDSTRADVLELKFKEVGVTPNNKYHVYVDKNSNLVVQWDYFSKSSDTIPRLSTPWTDYQDYNGLILSSGRGNNRAISEIEVVMSDQ